ncbi:hypothetical protein [Microbacterium sp.]|uniref:hypothetical protein n=1 Tax=Microbacterium sp. TaxID=51671 RepID=UPI0025E3E089|nr:hypothetical protein [Microbacterium sp.]
MKVEVKTPNGSEMTASAATTFVGSALRIAPDFIATTMDESESIRTEISVSYSSDAGRYVVRRLSHAALSDSVELNYKTAAKVGIQPMVQAAAPHCIFLTLGAESEPTAAWLSVAELTTAHGRILPSAIAAEVVRRGSSEARMDAIEILYGSAALGGLAPAKLIQAELGIPHRTASAWIIAARQAGRLKGMNFNAARPASDVGSTARMS